MDTGVRHPLVLRREDRASSRIPGIRGTFESRRKATSRRDSCSDRYLRRRWGQQVADMLVAIRGERIRRLVVEIRVVQVDESGKGVLR